MDETQLQAMVRKVRELSREKIEAGYKVGVICTDESRDCYTRAEEVRSIGRKKKPGIRAHNLYALLREFDDWEWTTYFGEFSQGPPGTGYYEPAVQSGWI